MAKKTTLTAHQKRLFKEFMDHAQAALKIIVELKDIEESQRSCRMRKARVSKAKRRSCCMKGHRFFAAQPVGRHWLA